MRTQKLLITAAAALAAGILSSQAQVYSQNIVGYVNTILPVGNTPIANPLLNADGTNGAEDVLTSLQGGDTILVWNGGGYNAYTYFGPGSWVDTFGNPTAAPKLPQGAGIFYQNGQLTAETNTFVGTVVLTNSVNLPVGNTLVASTAPIADSAEGTNINLPLQGGDSLLLWNGGGYNAYTYFGPGTWVDTFGNPTPAPTIPVGAGFFYQNGQLSAETWIENVVVQ